MQHLDCCTDCLLFAANGTLPSEGTVADLPPEDLDAEAQP